MPFPEVHNMTNYKDGWIDADGADYHLRLIYNKLLRDLGVKELWCMNCRKILTFEEWKHGSQGGLTYCPACFDSMMQEILST
jgi:hypothetical protein